MKDNRRLSPTIARLGVATVAIAAILGVAACGGDDSEGSSGGGSIDLVAYSTPQQAFEEGIIPAFQDTSEGERRRDLDLVRRLRRPASRGRGGPARRLPRPLAGAGHDAPWSRPARSPRTGTRTSTRGRSPTRSSSSRPDPATPRASRTGTTWSPGTSRSSPRTRRPRAAPSGTSWPPTARRSRRGSPSRRRSTSSPQIIENTSVLDDSARDSLQTFASGKGDVLIGYENEAIQAQDEGIELEYVHSRRHDPDREPGSGDHRGPGSRRGAGAPRLHLHRRGSADLRRLRVPPGGRVGARRRTPTSSRRFPACSRSRSSAAGTRSTTSSSTTSRASVTQILREQGAPLE